MTNLTGRLLLFLVIGSICAAGPASAQITTYSNRSDWEQAAGTIANISFDGIAPAGGAVAFSTAAGLVQQGVTFVGTVTAQNCNLSGCSQPTTTNELLVADSANNAQYGWASGGLLVGPGASFSCSSPTSGCTTRTSRIAITLPPGATAFGADFRHLTGSPGPFGPMTVSLPGGESYSFEEAFLGVTSATPFAGPIVVTVPSAAFATNRAMVENFSIGVPSTTPPASSSISDTFETPLDPDWIIVKREHGTIGLSSEQNHTPRGGQSLKFASTPGGQRAMTARRYLGRPT